MKIVHRCDGGPGSLGMGHVIRNIALALELRNRQHRIVFLMKDIDQTAHNLVAEHGFELAILPKTIPIPEETGWMHGAGAIIIDLYPEHGGTPSLYREARRQGKVVAFMDYPPEFTVEADIVVCPHVSDNSQAFRMTEGTIRLFGPQYVLLREQFRTSPPGIRSETGNEVLVTFGGSDSTNCTQLVAEALSDIAEIHVMFVLGPNYRHEDHLVESLRNAAYRFSIYRNAGNMSTLMKKAHLAISSAGGTAYELCATATPTIIIQTEKNQELVASTLSAAGAVVNAGEMDTLTLDALRKLTTSLLSDVQARRALTARASALIDGLGSLRVADAIESLWN